jgi:hypothetical protein
MSEYKLICSSCERKVYQLTDGLCSECYELLQNQEDEENDLYPDDVRLHNKRIAKMGFYTDTQDPRYVITIDRVVKSSLDLNSRYDIILKRRKD